MRHSHLPAVVYGEFYTGWYGCRYYFPKGDAMTTATEQATAERQTVSLYEFAETFGISYRHAADLAARGEIPGAIRLGRRVVIPKTVVERLLRGDAQAVEQEG